MFCHGKGLCKKLMEREWLTSLGINVGNLQEIGSRFPMVFSEALVWLVAQSRLTLYNLMDCSLPSSSVHGILQAKILEWVAIPFSRASSHGPAVNLSLLPNFMNLPSVTRLQESSWVKTWARWVSNPCSCFGEDHFRWRKFKDGNKPGNFIGREASGAEAEWGEE